MNEMMQILNDLEAVLAFVLTVPSMMPDSPLLEATTFLGFSGAIVTIVKKALR